MRRALYLCGGQFTLTGDVPDNLWSDEVCPFTEPQSFSFSHRLHLERCSDPSLVKSDDLNFSYRRHDLLFVSTQGASSLWFDGGVAAVLAGLELALSQAVRARGGALVHASAGISEGHCWLMPGPSGTGKSTAVKGGFDEVLSDERVAILPSDSGYRVWSTPFWSDGRELDLSTGSAPLGTIAFLRKAKRVAISGVDQASMVAWLVRSLVLYESAPEAQVQVFDLACRIVNSVRCVKLDFPREGIWVPSVSRPIGLAS